MRSLALCSFAAAAQLLLALTLTAQDTRTVTKPHIPPACVTLKARIAVNRLTFACEDAMSIQ